MQIQNQLGRDDTIDPYYLTQTLRRGNTSSGGDRMYTIERRIGSQGEIYYQLVETNSGNSVGEDMRFSANDLLYDNTSTVEYVIDNLVRRDSEVQEALETLNSSMPQTRKTFDELDISTENKTVQQVITELSQKELTSDILVIGQFSNNNNSLPTDLQTADVEIKTIYTENGTYYEVNAYSDDTAPYKWTSLYKDNTMLMSWTPAYGGGSDAATIMNLQSALESHASNSDIHITAEERIKWDNHVGVEVNPQQETLIFYN